MKHNTEYHNISDLTENERDILLEMLWNKSSSQGQSQLFNFDIKLAKNIIINEDGFAGNICGRYINVYLYIGNIVDSYLYDKENGRGCFGVILELLREKVKKNNLYNNNLVDRLEETHI
tara:strand:- start:847 stop:1203 length:357 start_codon:yes stop_codon:yes gene_type:complete